MKFVKLKLLRIALENSDLVITTTGVLGPTKDDKTKKPMPVFFS